MIIPGALISLATFPGYISKGVITSQIRKITHVEIKKVSTEQSDSEKTEKEDYEYNYNFRQIFSVSVGNFVLSSILSIWTFIGYQLLAKNISAVDTSHPLGILVIWLGLSFAVHSFPSREEAKTLWKTLKGVESPGEKIIGYPLGIIFWIVTALRYFWLDFIYGGLLFHIIKELFSM